MECWNNGVCNERYKRNAYAVMCIRIHISLCRQISKFRDLFLILRTPHSLNSEGQNWEAPEIMYLSLSNLKFQYCIVYGQCFKLNINSQVNNIALRLLLGDHCYYFTDVPTINIE